MNYSNSLSESEREMLKKSRVLVAGLGGLGGYTLELLTRLGVGEIVCVDGDCFDKTNLNRQLLCTLGTLGMPKALAAQERAREIDPGVKITAVTEFIDAKNAARFVGGCDLVIDALDTIDARAVLHEACSDNGIDMVFGAISPWTVQFGVIPPRSEFFKKLTGSAEYHGEAMLSFVPSLCASYQVSEAVKLLTGNKSEYYGKLCTTDLLAGDMTVIEI